MTADLTVALRACAAGRGEDPAGQSATKRRPQNVPADLAAAPAPNRRRWHTLTQRGNRT